MRGACIERQLQRKGDDMTKRKWAALAAATFALAIGVPTVYAGGEPSPEPTKAKCNSGRGNGSELVNGVDCDPGKSAGHNKGGD